MNILKVGMQGVSPQIEIFPYGALCNMNLKHKYVFFYFLLSGKGKYCNLKFTFERFDIYSIQKFLIEKQN